LNLFKTKILKKIVLVLTILTLLSKYTEAGSKNSHLDVRSYYLTIEPSITEGIINGSVKINFLVNSDADSVIFNSGDLEITNVSGEHVVGFKKINNDLIVYLSKRDSLKNEIAIDYNGHPKKGLIFDHEHNQAYTIFFTSHWMICNDSPEDKALFHLNITVPFDKTCIASGVMVNKNQQNDKITYIFQQNTEAPSYTYGFVIGKYNKAEKKHGKVLLKYYSQNYSSDELMTVFQETQNMISFFEEKSGVEYFQSTYSQILTGNNFQEMSGYSILKDNYGKMVLQDSTETNLISHELAHQWWGNQITCKSFNHFWLNEGMATFMSAAYNEYRFGKKVYLSNIESYYKVYEGIKEQGNDRSLVFEDWLNPSKDDRNLVYFKGAYFLHLLKEKLGDEAFWKAIRFYSKKYCGKSVETADFQKAFEESSSINLEEFFNKWIY
jgi:aminopeptidase N